MKETKVHDRWRKSNTDFVVHSVANGIVYGARGFGDQWTLTQIDLEGFWNAVKDAEKIEDTKSNS